MRDAHQPTPLGQIFDQSADRYQAARPEYPPALFDALIELTGVTGGDRLLEIGCATGKATVPLARRGFRITAVERGTELSAVAKINVAPYPLVTVEQGAFETWPNAAGTAYDLVFAATAWHWLDPAVRYRRAFDLLRPGGHLAFWTATHVFPEHGDPFFTELQEVYRAIGAVKPGDDRQPRPGQLPDESAEILASGLFGDVQVREFDWELDYTVDQYLALLEHLLRPPGAVRSGSSPAVRRNPPSDRRAAFGQRAPRLGGGSPRRHAPVPGECRRHRPGSDLT